MNVFEVILAIIFPPLAVMDRGCGSFIIVTILTILGWIPGVLAALIILSSPKKPMYVAVPQEPTFEEKIDNAKDRINKWAERKKAEREAKQK